MKYIKQVFVVGFSCLLLAACGSNSNTTAAAANTISASTGSDAVFSYTLDGTKISGGVVDELMTNNIGEVTGTGTDNKKLQFFLNDAYKESTETFAHSLRFTIPGKTGTTSLVKDQDEFNIELFLATGAEGKYILYGNEDFTITVSSISTTRVAGTFSGKLKLVPAMGAGKDELVIADGKFDIPIRKTK